jgi:hypothetical protein
MSGELFKMMASVDTRDAYDRHAASQGPNTMTDISLRASTSRPKDNGRVRLTDG